jgi:hypothetical protein
MSRPRAADPETQKRRELCNRILALNPKIRYVGMLNTFGKPMAASFRQGVKPLFKPTEARDEFFLTATRESLRSAFSSSLGRHNFTLTVHDKVKLVSFTSDTVTIYISVGKDASYDEIAKIVEGASKLKA